MQDRPIYGLSLGCERIFRLQYENYKIDVPLAHGSLYIIRGETNMYWTHSIVAEESKNDTDELRISLTFR